MNSVTMQNHATETSNAVYEPDRAMPKTSSKTLGERLESIASISQLIRIFGSCAVLISMSLFMLKGWSDGNDINRYLKLLAQTGLLSGAGLALTFLLKEFKGARAFFGLALVSVVANFTILGSLTYSLFALDSFMVEYPAMMKWEVVNAATFAPVLFGAVALLSAVSYFGFSVFARRIAKPLTIGFLALSALLLIPVRSSLIATGLAAIAFCGAWILIKRLSKTDKLVFTKEAKAALAILLLPGLIIVARALSFYHIDEWTMLAVFSLAFFGLRSITMEMTDFVSRVIAASKYLLSVFIALLIGNLMPATLSSFVFFVPMLAILGFALDQLHSQHDRHWKNVMSAMTTTVVTALALLIAATQSEFTYSIQAIVICGLAWAFNLRATSVLEQRASGQVFSILALIAAILMMFFDLVHLAQLGNWMIIGIIGGGLILGASIYERYGLNLSKA